MTAKLSAEEARVQVWEGLRKVAKPDSRFSWDFSEFITDYDGSDKCAELICGTDIYNSVDVIFITPDNNLTKFRERVIRDGKYILMTNYGITRGFFLIEPQKVPKGKEELASTLDGVQEFWQHLTLKQIKDLVGNVDLLVTGASAMSLDGVRFGKGHGYFDLEWAMLYSAEIIDNYSVVIGVGHDCQVIDTDIEVKPYDTVMDYIVTPTRIIKTEHNYEKPNKGIIWSLLEPGMLEKIPPLQELWCSQFCK